MSDFPPQPISRKWGFDRGKPIDRYYIENFLAAHTPLIQGHVLEVLNNAYTLAFGSNVQHSDVLSLTPTPAATIIGDLSTGFNIPVHTFDCIILTQTLHLIYDVKSALHYCMNALKPGGTLLMTVPGISQVSRSDMDRWGDYWRFTNKAVSMLLTEVTPESDRLIQHYGNVATAKAFLDGRAVHELPPAVMDYQDDDYQVTISARVTKPS